MKHKTPERKRVKRVGRGPGSGNGKTAGRGHKGQGARSGSKSRLYSEGGQISLIRRLPKKGFNPVNKKVYDIVSLSMVEKIGKQELKPLDLIEAGVIKRIKAGVKILSDGELTKAFTVHAHAFSKSAKEKIEKAGGKVVIIPFVPEKIEA